MRKSQGQSSEDQLTLWSEASRSCASRTASPAVARAKTTRGTSGRTTHESSKASDPVGYSLRTYLACELRKLTPYSLTWKDSGTPLGRPWWVLGRSAHPTSGTGCGSWPTASVMDSAGFCGKPDKGRVGPNSGRTLTGKALELVGLGPQWPTPRASENENRATGPHNHKTDHGKTLASEVHNWPTPRSEESEQTGGHRGTPDTLTSRARSADTDSTTNCLESTDAPTAAETAWPLASAKDAKNSTFPPSLRGRDTIPGALMRLAGPPAPASDSTSGKRRDWLTPHGMTGTDATGKAGAGGELHQQVQRATSRGQLNPAWVAQLQGYPPGWLDVNDATS